MPTNPPPAAPPTSAAAARPARFRHLPPPKGITVADCAAMLRLSTDAVLWHIKHRAIVAWKPFPRSRAWRIDEVVLAAEQAQHIAAAREAHQMEFAFD